MKKSAILISAFILSLCIFPTALVFAAEEAVDAENASLIISRLVIAGSIEDREPVGVVNAFSASTEKVYCFLEAKEILEVTTVSFVWYYGDTKTATVELPIGISPRWRTYSSKKLGGRTGEWKVELQDAGGNVLDSVAFTVE